MAQGPFFLPMTFERRWGRFCLANPQTGARRAVIIDCLREQFLGGFAQRASWSDLPPISSASGIHCSSGCAGVREQAFARVCPTP